MADGGAPEPLFRPVTCSHIFVSSLCRALASLRPLARFHGTMLSRLAPRRRALSSATRALRPLRVGGVPEHFNTPWHTAHAAGRFDELGLQVDSWIAGHEGPSIAEACSVRAD